MPRLRHTLVAALAVPALILGAVACSDDDNSAESNSNASAQQVDEINARIQRNEMAVALLGIGNLPLHDIDETVSAGEEIPNNAIPSMRTVIRLVAITEWDSDLQADAEEIARHAEEFIAAAEADDHGAVAEHATAVHDGWHDFSGTAWDVVAPGTGSGEHSDDEAPHSEQTPHEEGETPEATP